MVEHTPGPWYVSRDLGCKTIRHRTPGYRYGSGIAYTVGLSDEAIDSANAKLIAAAPDLLAALHRIAYEPIGHPEASATEVLTEVVEIAKTAIAKAQGDG